MSASTPKTMSSRLMTMKFMQRGAAKSAASSPTTSKGPPSKKLRLASGASAPGTPGTPDHEILQSALVAEEKKRQEALDKAAQHTGETKWVLSYQDPLDGKRQDSMQVRQVGFAEIDAEDDSEEEEETRPIRMHFGGGLKKKADVFPFGKAENSGGEAESSSGEYDSEDPTAELIRQTKHEMAAEKRDSRKARTSTGNDSPRGLPRRPNDGTLNGLTSISGGGGGGGSKSSARGSAGRGRGKGRR
ncbi:hypothetical protein EJ02DRAFT_345697 [Clathrospora elynae]|uniref:Uncharacterized protein n=1 Tax=Clathrospora elynae TaxID=706981 RepID=A0A6A5SRF9_9PLEO|nr:hypothetical protein EJ02DRAFT_345697 [Clathrospora elynae]